MNKDDLEFYVRKRAAKLLNSLLRVVAAFPREVEWDDRHVDEAMKKLTENPELSTEQVIKHIKRSHLCFYEKGFVDKLDGKPILLTDEERQFNERVKK